MPDPVTTFEELRALSAFDGDSVAAGRALHEHFSARWHEVGLALLLVRDEEPGRCRLAGLIGSDGTELLPSTDPFGRRMELPQFDDALAQRSIGQVFPHVVDVTPGERGLPLGQALLLPAALLALPIPVDGRIQHWLVLTSTVRHRFDNADVADAMRDATLTYALLTRPLALRTLADRTRRQHREIEGLAEVQKLLQPDNPVIGGLRYSLHWQPAETAAGDYYDLMALTGVVDGATGDGRDVWGLIVADVSGHGAAAAMESVQLDAILRTYNGDEAPLGPAGALNYTNRHFFSRRQRRHFVTVFSAGFRPDRDGIQYVCAGHPPAILRRGDELRWLGKDQDAGIPLGILREHRWENSESAFLAGDVLIAYTDGLVEAKDSRGRMFGSERIAERVMAGPCDVDAIRSRVLDALFEHQNATVGIDDQTLIVLQNVG
jgi:sigma-B regulation protein RsbU (phosphoserine phosphatase)